MIPASDNVSSSPLRLLTNTTSLHLSSSFTSVTMLNATFIGRNHHGHRPTSGAAAREGAGRHDRRDQTDGAGPHARARHGRPEVRRHRPGDGHDTAGAVPV